MRARPTYCDFHKDKQLELFCYDCNQAFCVLCSLVDHKTHLKADLQSSSTKFRDEIKTKINPCLAEYNNILVIEKKLLDDYKINLSQQIEAS